MFNDLAVCALHAITSLGIDRVAVLDLDVHQGDGTASIFADEPRVLTVSVHRHDVRKATARPASSPMNRVC